MAIQFSVTDPSTGRNATVSASFEISLLVDDASYSSALEYYIKVYTNTRDTSGNTIQPKTVLSLSDLALNGNNQSDGGSALPYATVKELVEDYVYDVIHGHTANQSASGVALQLPINLS